MNIPILRARPNSRGLSINVSQNGDNVILSIGGFTANIFPDIAIEISNRLVDCAERAQKYQPPPAPEAP